MAIDTNADFTPTIPDSGVVPVKSPYNPTGSFKFWAQKVLPLVYDDSLSYYEVLCKVVNYLNNVIQNVDNLNDSVNSTNQSFETLKGYVNTTKDTLINTYNELQDYVNTYFDNLDVQQEINAKLDAMADSGKLTTLLAPFIPDLVTQWLNNHVTPTSPVVDNTLSISGAAADAKVTGDKITALKEDLTDISSVLSIPYSETATGTTPQNSQANTIIDGIPLESGKNYVIDLTYSAASDAVSYLYLTDSQINVLNAKTISAGTTSVNVVYYAQNSYENAKLLINSTNRALDYKLTIHKVAENKIDALERDKLSAYEYKNAATFTFTSAGTMTQPCPVKNGSVYKVTVTGDKSVAANVRSGNGYTKVDDIALECYAGNTYFTRYTGADAPNLLVFASGACTVTVEDISTLSGSEERRIYATVSTVRELLECIEISHTVKMTIYLNDGVYDLISGLGETYFANAPSQNFGPVLCNDVEIVGGEGAVITANYTGDNTNVMTYFAAFNTGKCVYPWTLYGGFSLKNVHLEGSKIRYLVHDENNQHDIPYHNVYDGCYFYFDNSENTSWKSQAIIGGGLGKHGYIEVKNCVFKTPALASRSAVVSYHNSLAVGAKSHIVLTGNLIAPLNAIFRLGYHGTSEEKTLVLATNNKWGGVPSVSAETSSDTVNNFELNEWNNVVLS